MTEEQDGEMDAAGAGLVDAALDVVRSLAAANLADVPDDELLADFAGVQMLNSMLRAAELNMLAEMDRRRITGQRHGLDTAEWWQSQGAVGGKAARLSVRHARELAGFDLVRQALAAGAISGEQSSAIVSGLVRLPSDAPAEALTEAQTFLLDSARELDVRALRQAALRVGEVVLPEQAELSQAEAAAEQQRRARAGRYFAYGRDEDEGIVWFRGRLPIADGEVLLSAVNAGANQAWRSEAATRAAGRSPGGTATLDAEASTMSQLRADALVDIAGRGPDDSPTRARLTVLVTVQDLVNGMGGRLAESGEPIDPGELRRLACDAGVLPVVLGGPSDVLDLGRERRLVSVELRQALVIRDQGCVFPGCDRPPGDCEAHHVIPWAAGGRTDYDNLVLLCSHHHRLVEPHPRSVPGRRWQVLIAGDGIPEVLPPARVDPGRAPIRHRRFAVDRLLHGPNSARVA